MLIYPDINPVAFHIISWPVYWYGLMYLFAFLICWSLTAQRVKSKPLGFTVEQVSDILFYTALGVIVGGRLGYMLFYDFSDLIHHPLTLVQTWKGGMSFHGGLIGVILSLCLLARKFKKSVADITDLIAPVVPLGLAAGRVGNFINGELWGRVTDVPWGMIFPTGGPLPRHPSQIYEFFLEGITMFVILWFYAKKPKPRWAISGLFLILYGCFRIFIEFFRQPDVQVGYLALDWVTEGQLLSLPMVILGISIMVYAYRGKRACANT